MGTGAAAIAAGARLGRLLATHHAAGQRVVLAISSDMAHYPPRRACAQATADQLPPLVRLDPDALVVAERAVVQRGLPGLVCGMCGIQPAILGLAALRALGVAHGASLAASTSADAGGPTDRTVGYLTVAWTT